MVLKKPLFIFSITILSLFATRISFAGAMIVNDPLTKAEIVKQIAEAKKQLEEIERQTRLFEGNKGFGGIHHDQSVHNYLPKTADGILEVNRHGNRDLTKIYDEILRMERWQGSVNKRQEDIKKRRYKNAITKKAIAKKAYEASDLRIKRIERLMDEIKNTNDPKSIAELQARISLEQAMLENEANRLNLINMMEKSEALLLEEHERELAEKVFDPNNTGFPKIR